MSNAFRALCAELGYSPDRVLSVRVNAGQVVVVTWMDSGPLQVTTYAQDPDGLRLVSQGTPIDVRRTRRAPGGQRNPGAACSSPTVDRHSDGRAFSFYVGTPAGASVEYGGGGLLVDGESSQVQTLDRLNSSPPEQIHELDGQAPFTNGNHR